MGPWGWPRQLGLALLLLWAASLMLQPANRWDAWLAASASALARWWGPALAVAVLQGSAQLLRLGPHVDLLPPAPAAWAWGSTFEAWLLWPVRGCVHVVALTLWIGLLAPALALALRARSHRDERCDGIGSPVHQVNASVRWPWWRRAPGLLPLATLCWCLGDPGLLWLAPAWAATWLFLAAVLWWPRPN